MCKKMILAACVCATMLCGCGQVGIAADVSSAVDVEDASWTLVFMNANDADKEIQRLYRYIGSTPTMYVGYRASSAGIDYGFITESSRLVILRQLDDNVTVLVDTAEYDIYDTFK